MAKPAPRVLTCPIHMRPGVLNDLGDLLKMHGASGAAIVTNEAVGPLYAEQAVASLAAAGLPATVVTLPDGEVHKTLDTVRRLYDEFLAAGLDRDAVVIGLGGGVVGDMAGFAAATYLRGVGFVQAPTTLLAMVDSSIGGKTGVDLPQGKNLVGAFVQPYFIAMDPNVLATLPPVELRNGLAEMIKTAIIGAPGLFAQLEAGADPKSSECIWLAANVKQDVVAEDPEERNVRALLNLGHTFGHAFEKLSDFTLPHGHGVAIGMAYAARLAVRRGLCAPEFAERIVRLLEARGLPVSTGYDPDAAIAAMSTDKKRRAGKLRFVLPRALGHVIVVDDIPLDDVRAVLAEGQGVA